MNIRSCWINGDHPGVFQLGVRYGINMSGNEDRKLYTLGYCEAVQSES